MWVGPSRVRKSDRVPEEEHLVKLYTNPLSPNGRRAAIVVKHLNLPVELVVLDFAKGEHKKPEFLAINPAGRLPALVDGSFNLSESRAIGSYLAEQKGDASFYPTEAKGRADVARWQFFDAAHFAPALSTIAFEKLLKAMMGLGAPSESVVAEATGRFESNAKIIDAHLTGRDWLVGKTLTLADLTLASSLTYAHACGLSLDPLPNLKAWFGRIRELEAWRATEPKMG